jgi:polyhydroxyalkanoate synthesis regulator phasin
MRDLVRKYVDAGREAVAGERAEELARDLLDWSRRSAERVAGLVRREVQRQLRLSGAATRDEVSDLRKRVRALERQVGAKPTAAGGARKSSAKKSPARKTSTRKTSSRKTSSKAPGKKTTSRAQPG